jgi:NAD(P)-dependent dehydrogenase (short-subunit alcohol dehydrogenase family)
VSVLVTGANRGIGLALAQTYAKAGETVLATARHPADAAALKATGAEVFALAVTDTASVATLAGALRGRPIDLLINNAGIIGPDSRGVLDTDLDAFRQTLDVNTLGPLRVTQALMPSLRLAKGAKIAVISSQMGSLDGAKANHIAYRASKAAVNKLVRGLATELEREGIAVASLHPGWVRTDMGGAGADIDPATSAAGIKAVLDRLDLASTNRFWNYDGRMLAW